MVATTQQTISWKRFRDDPTDLEAVYFRWIQPGAAAPTITGRAEQIFRHHLELAAGRRPGTALTRLYRVGDGSDLGPALQIVNDDMPLLVDSLTAALQRLGATVTEVVHPVFDVLRDRRGRLRAIAPSEGFDAAQANPDSRGEASGNVVTESWIHVQLGAGDSDAVLDRIERALPPLLAELRQVAHDTEAMTRTMASLAARLDVVPQPSAAEASDCAQLLRWLTSGHFNLLGYGYYRVHPAADGPEPQQVSGTALGVLRSGTGVDVGAVATGPDQILRLSNGSLDSLLPGSPDVYVVSVADYGAETTPSVVGTVVGEHVFVGTFTVSGLHENILDIPVISRRVHQVIEWAGLALNSFSGQALLEMLQTFPRVELFSTDARRLFETVSAVMNLGLRRQIRLFLRRDVGSNAVYCLVYLPRDRYSTEVRTRMYDILRREFDAEQIAYSARVTESELAVVYFTVHRGADAEPADITETNRERVQDLLFATTRSWADRLVTAAAGAVELEPTVVADYAAAFPASYRQEYEPERALDDLRRLHGLSDGGIDTDLYRVPGAPAGEWRFALYVAGAEVSLSRVLPVLHSLGVEVLEEQPYRLELPDSNTRWIYDFGLRVAANTIRGAGESDPAADLDQPTTLDSLPSTSIRRRLPEAVSAMWFGDCEVDGLNELVLRAGLHWRQIAMLRAYAKYLQQAGFAYTFANITRVLLTHPSTARAFTELFDAYFDPEDLGPVATARAAGISARLQDEIDAVVSLDTDRILRAILGLITATLRTNYFRRDADGNPLGRLSFKFDPHAIAELPRPRPRFEIFVYSPRVEGVHLRFGAVARGGLRWSDRL
ncbi:NAD-glutamate dehydrogenase domain-containing protein, partial [Nocardia sp. NPDC052254]|uniref:NAD-glutamate dehydrogenase domain-containing protein n=1 Tax=Nocardia sp. NPDC052254 TaxID=3155681 RepID=UPI003430ADF0